MKNLEAKPLSIELLRFASQNHNGKGVVADWHDLYDRFTPLEISTVYSGDKGNLLII